MSITQIDHEIVLAKRIEAGVIAQEILDGQLPCPQATPQELQILADEGKQAKEELILAHLGLVRVIAAEAARYGNGPVADLFQEGCLALQQAVMKYDWRKGGFGPYAGMWIRAAVRHPRARTWVPVDHIEILDVSVEETMEQAVVHEGLTRVLSLIDPRQSQVLRLRSGWEGHPRTRKATAHELGLTIAQVRHLEKAGLETMRFHWEESQAA